jgi:hypothetical protein
MRLASLIGLMVMGLAASMSMGQAPPPPPAPVPGMTIDWTTCTVGSDANNVILTVNVKLFNIGAGNVWLNTFNENTSDWDYGTPVAVAGQNGPVVRTFVYTIPKNTGWGGDYADNIGAAYVSAHFASAETLEIYSDEGWFYQ